MGCLPLCPQHSVNRWQALRAPGLPRCQGRAAPLWSGARAKDAGGGDCQLLEISLAAILRPQGVFCSAMMLLAPLPSVRCTGEFLAGQIEPV